MNRYEAGFDGVTASAAFKSRLNERLNGECLALQSGAPAPEQRMSAKRKALLILIALLCYRPSRRFANLQRKEENAHE